MHLFSFSLCFISESQLSLLLLTHADRQGVDISVTVGLCVFAFLCICTVTDFSFEDKASSVIFCMAVHRRPRQRICHFCELCAPSLQKPKIGRATPTSM